MFQRLGKLGLGVVGLALGQQDICLQQVQIGLAGVMLLRFKQRRQSPVVLAKFAQRQCRAVVNLRAGIASAQLTGEVLDRLAGAVCHQNPHASLHKAVVQRIVNLNGWVVGGAGAGLGDARGIDGMGAQNFR